MNGLRWCEACAENVKVLRQPICPICGITQSTEQLCVRCSRHRPGYFQLRSWGIFTGSLRNAIHKLKYQRDMSLAEILSRPLIDIIKNLGWAIDIIVPVPLSRYRIKTRGYNQAALIAIPISLGLNLKYQSKALIRVRDTKSQVDLSYEARIKNVFEAFSARPALIYDKRILVVDDVVTSGATLNACAEALINSGAEAVYAVTLARALYN